MEIESIGSTLPGITHHRVEVNGTKLHYIAAGKSGSPILLVHRFPETWWTFRKLIPLLASSHRVFAVDLRGFGDSDNEPGVYDSKTSAEDLHLLIERLQLAQSTSQGRTLAEQLYSDWPRHTRRTYAVSPRSIWVWPGWASKS